MTSLAAAGDSLLRIHLERIAGSHSEHGRCRISSILSPAEAINGTVRQQSNSLVFVSFTWKDTPEMALCHHRRLKCFKSSPAWFYRKVSTSQRHRLAHRFVSDWCKHRVHTIRPTQKSHNRRRPCLCRVSRGMNVAVHNRLCSSSKWRQQPMRDQSRWCQNLVDCKSGSLDDVEPAHKLLAVEVDCNHRWQHFDRILKGMFIRFYSIWEMSGPHHSHFWRSSNQRWFPDSGAASLHAKVALPEHSRRWWPTGSHRLEFSVNYTRCHRPKCHWLRLACGCPHCPIGWCPMGLRVFPVLHLIPIGEFRTFAFPVEAEV